MKTEALKYEIIEWITQTNDSTLLNTLKSIKDSNTATKDWYEELNQEQIESIQRGIENHEKGEVLTSKEFLLPLRHPAKEPSDVRRDVTCSF